MTEIQLPFRTRSVLGLARVWLTLRHPILVERFVRRLGYLPNPAAPVTYHERMLWRKIIDRNPLFVVLTDKLAAKKRAQILAPELRLPETFWVGDDAGDIPARLLEGDVVVKSSCGCNMNLFVSSSEPEIAVIKRQTRQWLLSRFGRRQGEWAYSLIQPKLFVEERLSLGGSLLPTDIKVHVCCGQVCHIWIEDRAGERSLLLDPDGNPLPGRDSGYPGEEQAFPMSERLAGHAREAAAFAIRLAADLDYIRVDFLVTESGLYGGEITVYSASGYGTWSNPAIARNVERLWDLGRSDYLRKSHGGLSRLYADALRAQANAAD